MVKWIAIDPYYVILHRNKKEPPIVTYNFDNSQENYVFLWKNASFKRLHIICSNPITFFKWQNDTDGEEIRCCHGSRIEEDHNMFGYKKVALGIYYKD